MNIKHEPIHRKYRQRDRPMTDRQLVRVLAGLAVVWGAMVLGYIAMA